MSYKKDAEIIGAHPGWAIRFEDGTWLSVTHGWVRDDSAVNAYIYNSKEIGEKSLTSLRSGREGKYFNLSAEVIEAWQPICESLRSEVKALKEINVVRYLDIFDLREDLESIMHKVKGWQEKSKQVQPDVNWEGLANFLGCNVDEVSTKLLALDPRSNSINVSNTNGDFNDH